MREIPVITASRHFTLKGISYLRVIVICEMTYFLLSKKEESRLKKRQDWARTEYILFILKEYQTKNFSWEV